MSSPQKQRIWDLPTRLFHWTLTILIVMQYATAQFRVLDMSWHIRGGYAVLTLLVFRLLWGFAGSQTSRFREFVRGPRALMNYLRARFAGDTRPGVGHNPLGGWSVLALLLCLAIQVTTGLFASDDLDTEGPLAAHVAARWVKVATRIHDANENVLLMLIALHVIAVLLYLLLGRENLITPMLSGRKHVPTAVLRFVSAWRALLLLAIAAGAVAVLVTLA
jgi:cytochrome b